MDRREEFKNVKWEQGRLLNTWTTNRWTDEQRAESDAVERKMAFAYFSAEDEGRERVFVFKYSTPEECVNAVNEHNSALEKAGSNVKVSGE
jgi:hypothetical protein